MDDYLGVKEKEKNLVTKVVNSVIDLKKTLNDLKNRSLGHHQKNMILMQSIDQIIQTWNDLHSVKITNDAYFVDAMDKIAHTIRLVLNKLPGDSVYDSSRLRLQSVFNFCYILISFRTGKQAMFRLQGTANMLATILTGIIKLENLELPNLDNPKYIELIERRITYMFSTSLMLISVIDNVPVLEYSDLIKWMNYIYEFFEQLDYITTNLPYQTLYLQFYNRTESQFFFNVEILNQWQFHFISATKIFQKLLSSDFLYLLDSSPFEQKNDPINQAIDKITEIRATIVRKLDNMFENGVFNLNNPPNKAKELQYSRNYFVFDKNRIERYRIFKIYVENEEEISHQEVVENIKQTINTLRSLEKANDDPDTMFKPEDTIYYIDEIKELMILLCIKCIIENDLSGFEKELEYQLQILKLIEIETNLEIQMLILQLRLYCYSLLENETKNNEFLSTLITLKPNLNHDPQSYSTLLILEILLKISLEHEPNETELIFKELHSIISTKLPHLAESVVNYKNYISNMLNENNSVDLFLPPINYLDYNSWIIPQLKHNERVLSYYPLNLKSQKIVR